MFSLSLRLLFWGISRFPGFPSNICCLRQNPMLPWFLRAVTHVVHGGVGAGGAGVHWVACRHPCPRTCFQPGVQFNLPTRFPIPDPSPSPVPAGDWEADLRGSSINRNSQQQLKFNRLSTPVLEKGVIPFSLPLLNSIDRARLGLPSLAFCPLRGKWRKYFCQLL